MGISTLKYSLITVFKYYIPYQNVVYNTLMNIKKRIEELRQQKGISIYELTYKAELSENTIYHWYNERSSPSLSGLIAVCKALDITIEEFFNPKTKDALSPREAEIIELFSSFKADVQEALLKILKTMKI